MDNVKVSPSEEVFNKLSRFVIDSGFLLHNYTMNTDKSIQGNMVYSEEEQEIKVVSEDKLTIPILMATKNFIYVISVRSYNAQITITSKFATRDDATPDKINPVHEVEYYARNLYDKLYLLLPDGRNKYIKPYVCFTGNNVKIRDTRKPNEINYIKVLSLNDLFHEIDNNEMSPMKCKIQVEEIFNKIKEVGKEEHQIKL